MDLRCGAPARPGRTPTYFMGGVQTIGTAGTNSANLLVNSPPVDCSLATDPNCIIQLRPAEGDSVPARGAEPVDQVVRQPRVHHRGWSHPAGPFDAAHVDGWNFHDTFFVTFKQAYLTAIGFDFSNYDDRGLRPGDEHLHVSVPTSGASRRTQQRCTTRRQRPARTPTAVAPATT